MTTTLTATPEPSRRDQILNIRFTKAEMRRIEAASAGGGRGKGHLIRLIVNDALGQPDELEARLTRPSELEARLTRIERELESLRAALRERGARGTGRGRWTPPPSGDAA